MWRAALEAEAGARLARGEAPPADSELARLLSEESIAAGAAAILAEADRLAGDESLLREIFDDCYRRFCLGAVRALTADYGSIPLYSGREWQVESGPAELVPRYEKSEAIQEVRARFSRESQSEPLVFLFPIDPAKADPARVARLYIGYRADAAWARARFEVIRLGRVYATSDRLHLYDSDFLEQELRWEDEPDPMARRPYMLLRDAGPAPAGAPAFAIRMIVRKAGPLEAWHAKIVRNYHQVFREANFARYYMTSLSLCLLNITLAIFSCSLVAYAFARLRWPGRDLCFGLLLATMMIPSQVTMIPGFLVHKSLGWYNTLLPLWAHAAFGAPFFIFLLRQFLKNVPADLEDAARIDGCGFLRIYWHVMLPLVKPTLATIAIFTFMGVWNNFMGPLIYVNDERLFPLALGIFKLSLDTRTGQDVALMMSGAFIMTLPIILLFFFVQRYFIQGISFTGMKG